MNRQSDREITLRTEQKALFNIFSKSNAKCLMNGWKSMLFLNIHTYSLNEWIIIIIIIQELIAERWWNVSIVFNLRNFFNKISFFFVWHFLVIHIWGSTVRSAHFTANECACGQSWLGHEKNIPLGALGEFQYRW